MNKLFVTVLIAGAILGLTSTAAAQQQQNQTQGQMQPFQVTGECIMASNTSQGSEAPFMTCQFERSQEGQMDSQSMMEQMMQRMREMMGQGMQGQNQSQGMGGQ